MHYFNIKKHKRTLIRAIFRSFDIKEKEPAFRARAVYFYAISVHMVNLVNTFILQYLFVNIELFIKGSAGGAKNLQPHQRRDERENQFCNRDV